MCVAALGQKRKQWKGKAGLACDEALNKFALLWDFKRLIGIMSRTVELKRPHGQGFGFSIIGGSDTQFPPMINVVVKDGASLKSGRV